MNTVMFLFLSKLLCSLFGRTDLKLWITKIHVPEKMTSQAETWRSHSKVEILQSAYFTAARDSFTAHVQQYVCKVWSSSCLFRIKQSFLIDWIAENNYASLSDTCPALWSHLHRRPVFKLAVRWLESVVQGANDSEGHAASIHMAVSPAIRPCPIHMAVSPAIRPCPIPADWWHSPQLIRLRTRWKWKSQKVAAHETRPQWRAAKTDRQTV
jgi:hypothetical protein